MNNAAKQKAAARRANERRAQEQRRKRSRWLSLIAMALTGGVQGTPTVYVDGEVLAALSVEALVAAIENAA